MDTTTTKQKRNYDNKRRVAFALLRQLGKVTVRNQPVYEVRVPKSILRIPMLKRQVLRALKTVGLSKENLK